MAIRKRAQTSDIPPERVAVFGVGDHEVAVCNVGGEFYAIDDLCTHDGESIAEILAREVRLDRKPRWAASSKPPRQAVERDQLCGRDAWPHQRPFVRPNKDFRDQRAANSQ